LSLTGLGAMNIVFAFEDGLLAARPLTASILRAQHVASAGIFAAFRETG
jgi:hypothetical protein